MAPFGELFFSAPLGSRSTTSNTNQIRDGSRTRPVSPCRGKFSELTSSDAKIPHFSTERPQIYEFSLNVSKGTVDSVEAYGLPRSDTASVKVQVKRLRGGLTKHEKHQNKKQNKGRAEERQILFFCAAFWRAPPYLSQKHYISSGAPDAASPPSTT